MVIKTGIILVFFNDLSSSHPIYDGTTWLCVSFHSPDIEEQEKTIMILSSRPLSTRS